MAVSPVAELGYRTAYGQMLHGQAEEVLREHLDRYRGQVQLLFTSPPFPLNRQKEYGNQRGEAYVTWLASFAGLFRELLAPTGSLVIELGSGWEQGVPVMSILGLEALLAFLRRGQLHLCQQFVCHNPARLPTPAQWVSVERIRVKDSYTHVWWMAATERPKADNRRVLRPYSDSMRQLLRQGSYNAGKRPSGHAIGGKSFLADNGGAIPSNVLEFSNTSATDEYLTYCREHDLARHPARMPPGLAEFFIKFLTEPGDLVLDPFAGSNTTGAAAERLERRWLAIEAREEYLRGSAGRFIALHPGKGEVHGSPSLSD